MKVHIFTKQQGKDFIEDIYDALDKAEFRESLPERLANDGLDFDSAIVMYGEGHTHQFTDLKSLVEELGKMGV